MTSESVFKPWLVALCLLGMVSTLAACGGSSSNVSPGKIVVEVGDPTDPTDPADPTDPGDGTTIATLIPANLEDAIYDSGETTPGGKSIYIIAVARLPGGQLDPTGLLLGNDVVFRIEGGALRIAQN